MYFQFFCVLLQQTNRRSGVSPDNREVAGETPALLATNQVIAKDYAVRFAADQRPVWAVGMNISQDRRTIDSFKIVKVK